MHRRPLLPLSPAISSRTASATRLGGIPAPRRFPPASSAVVRARKRPAGCSPAEMRSGSGENSSRVCRSESRSVVVIAFTDSVSHAVSESRAAQRLPANQDVRSATAADAAARRSRMNGRCSAGTAPVQIADGLRLPKVEPAERARMTRPASRCGSELRGGQPWHLSLTESRCSAVTLPGCCVVRIHPR